MISREQIEAIIKAAAEGTLTQEHIENINKVDESDVSPLLLAFVQKNVPAVKTLMARGADLGHVEKRWQHPIFHMVVTLDFDEIIPFLVERKCDLEAQDKNGDTALMKGLEHLSLVNSGSELEQALKTIQALMVAGSCNAQNKEGETALQRVLKSSSLEMREGMLREKFPLLVLDKFCSLLIERSSPELLNARNKEGIALLHLVSKKGLVNVASLLIERKADVEVQDRSGQTPVIVATKARQVELLKVLLSFKANVNAQMKNGDAALHIAVQNAFPEVVAILIQGGAELEMPGEFGFTPLRCLPINKKTSLWEEVRESFPQEMELTLKTLLGFKANIDAQDKRGWTLAHAAAGDNYYQVIPLLAEGKANLDIPNQEGNVPLQIAGERMLAGYTSREYFVNALAALLAARANSNIPNAKGETLLHRMAGHCETDMMSLCLQQGAHVNTQDAKGDTALMKVLSRFYSSNPSITLENRAAAIRILLNARVDVNIQNARRETALHAVGVHIPSDVVPALVVGGERRADLNVQDVDGETPLMRVMRQINKAKWDKEKDFWKLVIGIFLNAGSDLDIWNKSNETVVHLAVRTGVLEVVSSLLGGERKADLEAQSQYYGTPLMLASSQGHDSIARLLLTVGASPNARNTQGQSVLHVATSQVVPVLIEGKADSEALDAAGETCLTAVLKTDGSNRDKLAKIKALLEGRVDPNRQNGQHETPLQVAMERRFSLDAIPLLVAAGATLGGAGADVETLLTRAAGVGNDLALETLFSAGANIHARSASNRSALMIAILGNFLRLVPMLVEFGAAEDPEEATEALREVLGRLELKAEDEALQERRRIDAALAIASLARRETINTIFVNRGLGLHNALHIAASEGFFQIIPFLIRVGGEALNVPDAQNRTPVDLARAVDDLNHQKTVWILENLATVMCYLDQRRVGVYAGVCEEAYLTTNPNDPNPNDPDPLLRDSQRLLGECFEVLMARQTEFFEGNVTQSPQIPNHPILDRMTQELLLETMTFHLRLSVLRPRFSPRFEKPYIDMMVGFEDGAVELPSDFPGSVVNLIMSLRSLDQDNDQFYHPFYCASEATRARHFGNLINRLSKLGQESKYAAEHRKMPEGCSLVRTFTLSFDATRRLQHSTPHPNPVVNPNAAAYVAPGIVNQELLLDAAAGHAASHGNAANQGPLEARAAVVADDRAPAAVVAGGEGLGLVAVAHAGSEPLVSAAVNAAAAAVVAEAEGDNDRVSPRARRNSRV